VNSTQDPIQNKSARAPWTRFLPLLVMGAVLALLAVGLLSETDDAKSVLEGRNAPAIAGETLEGTQFSSSALKGKPMVINFWASWCEPCREEAPLFRELAEKLEGQATLVGILMRDNPDKARAFAGQFGYDFPNLLNTNNNLAFDYGVTAPPETFFVDSSGKVVKRKIGAISSTEMRQNLELLGIKL
jgi:cytochrome c biogenesis protein CcmG, thiol:disulfide interchange protein DsbE